MLTMSRSDFAGLTSSSSTETGFLKEIIVEQVDSRTKKVTSRVSWQPNSLRSLLEEAVVLVTDWYKVAQTGGDTGGGGTFGNWRNPRTLGSVDLGPGNSATGLDVLSKIVYISATASDSKKDDLYVVDATNGEDPFVVGSTNTGPGLNGVDAAGTYAYVANNKTSDQLQIIDVSNQSAPTSTSSFTLPGVSGSGAVGWSVLYYGGKVYISTKKASGPEFHIIDVSNPASPASLGSKEINADVNAITINGNIAYIATSDTEELKALDISNPASIVQVGGYSAPGDSEDGKSFSIFGNKLYMGRLVGGDHDDHHELHILDISSSTTPQNLGSKDIAASVNGLVIRDGLAFLGTSDSNKEFQVWDVSNPQDIEFWSSFNFPQVATGVDYEDNLVYVSVRSNDALRIVTSQ